MERNGVPPNHVPMSKTKEVKTEYCAWHFLTLPICYNLDPVAYAKNPFLVGQEYCLFPCKT